MLFLRVSRLACVPDFISLTAFMISGLGLMCLHSSTSSSGVYPFVRYFGKNGVWVVSVGRLCGSFRVSLHVVWSEMTLYPPTLASLMIFLALVEMRMWSILEQLRKRYGEFGLLLVV